MSELSTTDSPFAAGLALVVGAPERRRHACQVVEAGGATAVEVDDPYTAMSELCRTPDGFSTIVLSLHGVYREELQIIAAVRRRFPHIEIWLTDLDGRSAALVDAMRLGADGLLGEDGLHRLSSRVPAAEGAESARRIHSARAEVSIGNGHAIGRPEAPVGDSTGSEASTEPPPSEPRRVAASGTTSATYQESSNAGAPSDDSDDPYSFSPGEPILTAEELRALLHDQPEIERLKSDG